MASRLSTKEIENKAIEIVKKYEKEHGRTPQRLKQGQGVDIVSGDRYIEVKGHMKRETNIRITNQTLKWVKENNRLDNFYIYRVSEMAIKPKLLIFKYRDYEDQVIQETRWIFQPSKIPELKNAEIDAEKYAK